MKYQQLCEEIMANVGGKENIKDVYHCFTRLRINVIDTSKVNVDALKAIKGVMGVVPANQQIQCVIGTTVSDVYKDFCELGNFEVKAAVDEKPAEAAADIKEQKKLTVKGVFDSVVEAISSCIQPLLPGIICAGMIKMLVSIFGPSVTGILPEGSDLLTLLTFAGDTPFYFLPVMVGYTGAKKFGLSPVTGMILGALLLHPTWTAMVAEGTPFKVFGINASLVSYSSSVVPMILVTFVASYIEKFFNKHVPAMLRMMAVMPLTVLVMLPLEFCLLAPLGNNIGQLLSGFILAIPNVLGPVGIGVIAAIYMFLVMTGMHLPVIMAIAVTYFTNGHEDVVLLAGALSTMSVAGMCLAAFIRAKKPEMKELGLSCFTANFLGGVSEPAIYGLMLPNKKLWGYTMAGAFVGGIVAGLMKVGVYTITSGANIINWMAFAGGSTNNLVFGIVAWLIAFVIPFVLTLVLGIDEK